jgi:tetratricopeptide (TPR) repeat protein
LSTEGLNFINSAKAYSKTPLGIVTLFVVLIEALATPIFAFADKTLQPILSWFIVCFPVLVLGAFVYLIARHHGKLYPPSEYRDEANFPKTPSQVSNTHFVHDPEKQEQDTISTKLNDISSEEFIHTAQHENNGKDEVNKESPFDLSTIDGLEMALLVTAHKGLLDESKNHLDALKERVGKESDRIRYEAIYLYYSFRKGKTDALTALIDLVSKAEEFPEAKCKVLGHLGGCFLTSGLYEKALDAYMNAITLVKEEEQKASLLEDAAECLFKLDKRTDAFKIILMEIPNIKETQIIARLYEKLADLYYQDNQPDLKAFALEMALQHKPNDTKLLFKAGYAYSDTFSNDLGFLHYRNLLKFSPEDTDALNNIGVSYSRLNLPIRAVKHYNKAWSLKETLSAANLAKFFLDKGFIDEANNLLKLASKEENPDPEVMRVIGTLAEKEKQESEEEKKVLTLAHQQQRFLIEFGKACFNCSPQAHDFSGLWIMPDNTEIDVTVTDNQIYGSSNAKYIKSKFEGSVYNHAAIIKYYKTDFSMTNDKDPKYKDDGKGYMFFSTDNKLAIMKIIDMKCTFFSLARPLADSNQKDSPTNSVAS